MPNDDQSSKLDADANQRTKVLTAETAAINAEIERAIAVRKLATTRASLATSHAAAEALAAAKAAQELAVARQGETEAELARLKAKFSELTASGVSSGVELDAGAASMETALLASKAMSAAAQTAAASLSSHLTASDTIFVYPSGQAPDLKALTCFRTCSRILEHEIEHAVRSLESATATEAAPASPAGAQAAFELPVVGVALDAVSKIISYFRSDFKVAGTELAVDHAVFAELISGQLLRKLPGMRVFLPQVYEAIPRSTLDDFFEQDVAPLARVYQRALTPLAEAETLLRELSTEPPQPAGAPAADTGQQRAPARRIAQIEAAIERLKQVGNAYATLLDSLVAAKDSLDALIRQHALSDWLDRDGTFILTAKVHWVGGAHYTEKNVWTLFGAMPFYVMGGAVVSYSLFEGKSGNLLVSETSPVHSGFRPVKKLAAFLSTA